MTITGTSTENQVLTAASTLADADGLGTLHYQWQRNTGGGFANVGTDLSTYTLGDADVGATIRVVTTYTDLRGTPETKTSAATAAVANVNDAPTADQRRQGGDAAPRRPPWTRFAPTTAISTTPSRR